jgi:hypothetical protein
MEKRRHVMSTTFFDGSQHDRRDHSVYPLPHVECDATTAPKLADIPAEGIMQSGLAFWAVSAVELDLFTELAAARLRTRASAR